MARIAVNPELLVWARLRSGRSIDALERLFPKLELWENGELRPTLKQLEDFARATYLPIGYLFLNTPPEEHLPITDLRTMGSKERVRPSPDMLDTIYICQQRQQWYREFARSTKEPPKAFVGSGSPADDIVYTAESIRHEIGFDLELRRNMRTWSEALRYFINQADITGILVMVSGVVGSNNKRRLEPEEFRGFALSDDLAPLIFINGADTKAAQMFTLAHELAHIRLGRSVLSNSQPSLLPDHDVERWCNQVAAEMLVPREAMLSEYNSGDELHNQVIRLARVFKVSTLVILRRIHDVGGLDHDQFWIEYQNELKRLQRLPKGDGGDFYLTLGARAGKRFTRALITSTIEGRSSFTEAFRLLGFKRMSTFRRLGHSLGVSF